MTTGSWIIIAIQILGFAGIYFFRSYTTEKGKNLATKEDVGEITQIVESIKADLIIKTEELKSELSYKNEHLIHLRATERAAIISYYKATWVLVLNFLRADLIKYEIDNFDEEKGEMTKSQYLRYSSEAEISLNKIKEEVSNLKYLRDISEAELEFFYDKNELISIVNELNLALSSFERAFFRSINFLLQVFSETNVKVNEGMSVKDSIIEAKRKRSDILANWYEDRQGSFSLIRKLNDTLKATLFKRLMSLTS